MATHACCISVSLIPLQFESGQSLLDIVSGYGQLLLCDCDLVYQDLAKLHSSVNPHPGENPEELRSLASEINKSFYQDILNFQDYHSEVSAGLVEGQLQTGDGNVPEAAPGEVRERDRKPRKLPTKKAQLNVATYNGGSWKAIQAFLLETESNVVLAQEHKLNSNSLVEARLWCKTRGWSSFWEDASTTPKGGRSGGTAIFTRTYIQA